MGIFDTQDPEMVRRQFLAEGPLYDAETMRTYGEVFGTYADSEYGQHHKEQELRFSPYTYESRDRRWADLGDDVHPLYHMKHTHDRVVVPMLKEQISSGQDEEISDEDIDIIRLTAFLHDTGECDDESLGDVTGDVPFWKKTTEDEKKEEVIRQIIYDELFGFIPDDKLQRIEDIVTQKDKTDYMTRFFRVAENLGYYMTGMRASGLVRDNVLSIHDELMEEEQTNPEDYRLKQLARMAIRVPAAWRTSLQVVQSDFPYVKRVLSDTADDHIFINTKVLTRFI